MRKHHLPSWLGFHSVLPKIFVAIFVFILVPVFVFTMFANYITVESLMEQRRQADLATIGDLERNLDLITRSLEDAGRLIAQSEEARGFFTAAARGEADGLDPTHCQQLFADALHHVAAVSFLDAGGRFIGEHKLERGRLSWYFNPTLLSKLNLQSPTWTDPFTIEHLDTGAEQRVIAVLVPVRELETHLGYVCVYMDTEYLHELIAGYGEDVLLVDQAECVVASRERVPAYTSLYQFRHISYSLLLDDKSMIVPMNRQQMVVTTRKYGPIDLKLVMLSSFGSIEGILNDYYYKLVAAALCGVLFALVAALFMARLFTRPIIKLRDVMAKASSGNLDVRYHSRARDEIEQLGNDFNQFLDTIQHLMAQRIQHEQARRELHLHLLQEQIQPHFLYNVLEMISSLVQSGLSKEALVAIQSLASFYRVSLSKGGDVISIGQEVRLTESYLQLQKMRYTEYMDYMLAIDPRILELSVPKLTLQPLIENAIYHGLKGKRVRGIVSVSGSLDEHNQVVFEVYDDGTGMDQVQLRQLRDMVLCPEVDNPLHFGLVSVIKRLNLHCGGRAEMQIHSAEGCYTSVRIILPATGDLRKEGQ